MTFHVLNIKLHILRRSLQPLLFQWKCYSSFQNYQCQNHAQPANGLAIKCFFCSRNERIRASG